MTNVSNVIGPSETWEPSNKTISIRTSTWKQHGTYRDSFDTFLRRILTEYERHETKEKEEGSF